MRWKKEDVADFEPGCVYPAEVVSAEEGNWDDGNPFINLKLNVFVGRQTKTQYATLQPSYPTALKQFCQAAKLADEFNANCLNPSDCVGKQVLVEFSRKTNKKGYLYIVGFDSVQHGIDRESYAERIKDEITSELPGGEDIPF